MYAHELLDTLGTEELEGLPGFGDLVELDLAALNELTEQYAPPQGTKTKAAFNSVTEDPQPAFQGQF